MCSSRKLVEILTRKIYEDRIQTINGPFHGAAACYLIVENSKTIQCFQVPYFGTNPVTSKRQIYRRTLYGILN